MNKTVFFVGTALSLGVFLSACNPAKDTFDYTLTSSPTADANQRTVRVSEMVEVKLTTVFELPRQSQVSQRTITGIEFGACFGTDIAQDSKSLNNARGYCDPNQGDDSPPDWITVSNNSSHMSAIPDVIVKRGQKTTVEHTFSFTSTELGEVVILPFIYATPEGDGPVFRGGTYLAITFEESG